MPKTDIPEQGSTERRPDKSDTRTIKENQKDNASDVFEFSSLRTSPFGENIQGEGAYLRAERIAAAVHLITSHIERCEPIRINLRQDSVRLIDSAIAVQTDLRATRSENVRQMQVLIRKLITLVRMLAVSGLASNQNVHVLVEALDDLSGFLTAAPRSSIAERLTISRDDLVPKTSYERKRQIGKDHTARSETNGIVKDRAKKDTISSNLASRQSRIIDILRKGGLLGIKDIVAILPEYSEKMIQRELATLVDTRQVRKIGEKRWSRYEVII